MDAMSMAAGRFQTVDVVDQTGSTNEDLVAAATAAPTVPRVLIAREQTSGRGRHDRTWEMPAGGGLLMSLYVPWVDETTAHIVPTCLGNAAIAAMKTLGPDLHLKWPNDIVDESDRKLGGMLSASVMSNGALAGVVAGLGVNVSWPSEEIESLPNAACLNSMLDDPIEVETLAAAVIESFDRVLSTAETYGVVPVHDRYRRHCRTLGRTVRIEQAEGDLVGVATDIDPSGALIVDVDGRQHRVIAGDVVHVRAQG